MKRKILLVVVALAVILGGWALTGGLQRAVENRIEGELVSRGLAQPMAGCMAERMAARLTLGQLREIEKLAYDEGEAAVPTTVPELLEKIRRVDDPEVIEVTASSAAICAFREG